LSCFATRATHGVCGCSVAVAHSSQYSSLAGKNKKVDGCGTTTYLPRQIVT
jgi:hypothetical protein